MADKRIYQLQDASVITGKYLQIDKSGNTSAERYLLDFLATKTWASDHFLTSEYDRCDEVVVTTGSDNIISFSSDVPSTDYVIVTLKLTMSDGTESVGIATDKTVSGFRYTANDDGTLLYQTTNKK